MLRSIKYFELTWQHNRGVGPYDLVNGLVGYGVYALERLPDPVAVDCLERIVDRLAELAERTPDGSTWYTPARLLGGSDRGVAPDGYYNLGVAHGVPGVATLLAAACGAGVARERADSLAREAIRWLLAQRLRKPGPARFPYWLAPGTEPVVPAPHGATGIPALRQRCWWLRAVPNSPLGSTMQWIWLFSPRDARPRRPGSWTQASATVRQDSAISSTGSTRQRMSRNSRTRRVTGSVARSRCAAPVLLGPGFPRSWSRTRSCGGRSPDFSQAPLE